MVGKMRMTNAKNVKVLTLAAVIEYSAMDRIFPK